MSWEYDPKHWYDKDEPALKRAKSYERKIAQLEKQVEYWKARAQGRFSILPTDDNKT